LIKDIVQQENKKFTNINVIGDDRNKVRTTRGKQEKGKEEEKKSNTSEEKKKKEKKIHST